MIEDKIYRLVKLHTGWDCREVDDETSTYDLQYCVNEGLPYHFTIRRFRSGAMFMLYTPSAPPGYLKRMADRMASTPGH